MYLSENSKMLLDEFRRYGTMEPRQFIIDLNKCDGMYLCTTDGQKIFDWTNYYASKLIGHNHPALSDPQYVSRLVTAANNKVSNPDFVTLELIEYYRLLHKLAPKCMRKSKKFEGQVFTVNSGAEAMENALKYLINLHKIKNSTEPRFVFFENGYHGRTIYTLNMSDMPHYKIATRDFHGLTVQNVMIPFPAVDNDASQEQNNNEKIRCIQKLEEVLNAEKSNIAGIVVEPMQGTGGHRLAVDGFFRELSITANKYNVPVCFDEVQTAGGPTGDVFMCDQLDLAFPPYVVATAKKFGVGAVFLLEPILEEDILDSTWSGGLVDMVRFVKEWSIVENEKLIERATRTGQSLFWTLKALSNRYPKLIHNVRGLGLYQGFSFYDKAKKSEFIDLAFEKHNTLLLSAGHDSVRLRPNLSVTFTDISKLLSIFDDLLSSL